MRSSSFFFCLCQCGVELRAGEGATVAGIEFDGSSGGQLFQAGQQQGIGLLTIWITAKIGNGGSAVGELILADEVAHDGLTVLEHDAAIGIGVAGGVDQSATDTVGMEVEFILPGEVRCDLGR